MSGDTRIPRDMCAGNTIPGETRIPMTAAHLRECYSEDDLPTAPWQFPYTSFLSLFFFIP